MSATGRGAERSTNDFYETPGWCTRAILRQFPFFRRDGESVIDPYAGNGAILRELPEGVNRFAIEKYPKDAGRRLFDVTDNVFFGDANTRTGLGVLDWRTDKAVHVITNPPFSIFEECVERWVPGRKAAFLLRLNALGAQSRADWWQRWAPDQIHVLPKRPAFTAVCKGLSKTKSREQQKSCGRLFPVGTKGSCSCGGSINDGADATEYAWFVWGVEQARLRVLPLSYCE